MSRIAVIGAGGFVGVSLIESSVLGSEAPPRAIVRNFRNMASLCRFGSAVDLRRADAEDVSSLAEALRGAEVAVNVTTGPPAGIVRSTRTIHEACRSAGVRRFVHLSSAVVYGDVPEPIGDDAPPLSKHWMPYARAKGASEVWLRERMSQGGGPEVIVLRPGIVWGVRSSHTVDLARSLSAKTAVLVGAGSGIFNGIYIANLVAAIRAACNLSAGTAGFYNVGDTETVTWLEFFRALGTPLGCDVERLARVSSERFPWSLAAAIDAIQNFGPVNLLYHRVKGHIPDGLKSAIRARLEGPYAYQFPANDYPLRSGISRELWHLQRVGHKLPIAKFARSFTFTPPVFFQEGIRRSLGWLASLRSAAGPRTLERLGTLHGN